MVYGGITYEKHALEDGELSGIYFERLGSAYIYEQHWKLLVFVGLNYYEDKLNLIRRYEINALNFCKSKISAENDRMLCRTSEIINGQKIPQLIKLQNSLHNMLIHKYREKRGIHFLGTMLKVIAVRSKNNRN